ncbi:unnamed protein product [Gadus morhua 'NCC']
MRSKEVMVWIVGAERDAGEMSRPEQWIVLENLAIDSYIARWRVMTPPICPPPEGPHPPDPEGPTTHLRDHTHLTLRDPPPT